MKGLKLKNKSYNYLQDSFQAWLDTLGYNHQAVYSLPIHVREFFYYLEQNEIHKIKDLHPMHIIDHYNHLKIRTNQIKKSGALSASYLNKHQQAIRLFFDYLRQSGRLTLSYPNLGLEKASENKIEVLTEAEIKELFEATEYTAEKPELEVLKARGCLESNFRQSFLFPLIISKV